MGLCAERAPARRINDWKKEIRSKYGDARALGDRKDGDLSQRCLGPAETAAMDPRQQWPLLELGYSGLHGTHQWCSRLVDTDGGSKRF